MHPTASWWVIGGIGGIALCMAGLFVAACSTIARPQGSTTGRAALTATLGVAAWIGLTGAAALSGLLAQFELRPPPFAFMFVATLTMGVTLGLSPIGRRFAESVPLWILVLAQSFRLPLELVMHEAAREGTMPRVMSFSGLNFDIVTGATAIVVGLWLRSGGPLASAKVWNAIGFALLCAIAAIAFASSPVFKAFGDDQVNTFVAYVPFIWLPTILVVAALSGHIVIWRKLKLMAG